MTGDWEIRKERARQAMVDAAREVDRRRAELQPIYSDRYEVTKARYEEAMDRYLAARDYWMDL